MRKADTPLTGRLKERNSISVLDKQGNPIASYLVKELPLPGHSPILEFIYGDVQLIFPGIENLVQNDREKLNPSPTVDAILSWTAERVWDRVQLIEQAQRVNTQKRELEIASALNDVLNQHAKRFLQELQTQIFVDMIEDPEGGGIGPRGGEGDGRAAGGKGAGGDGTGGLREIPGDSERVRRPRFPQVLLSGYDMDPAKSGAETKRLTDRHPPLEQDDVDKAYNVWWINTEHVFAKEALARGGPKGAAFKSYQLHMFRDVVQREALRFRQRREAELSLDLVENELADISNRFLSELPHDLISELLS